MATLSKTVLKQPDNVTKTKKQKNQAAYQTRKTEREIKQREKAMSGGGGGEGGGIG